MKYRQLGGGLRVSALGVGCMPMVREGNIRYGVADDEASIRTIHRAIELGVTLFDTAEAYGPYTNEILLGQAIRGKRDGLVIATKFARRWVDGKPTDFDGTPANARRACEASLKRLGIEVIDLFYLHRVDPRTPIEDTVGAMADLVREGKVRHLGLSEASPDNIRRACAVHPITALQSEYSLRKRSVEGEVLDTCRALNIGFVPYSPLASGFLTGSIRSHDDLAPRDSRRVDARYQDERLSRTLDLVQTLARIAQRHAASSAQVALAWLLAQGNDIVPIPGVKRVQTLEDSLKAVELQLDAEDLQCLDGAAPRSVPR